MYISHKDIVLVPDNDTVVWHYFSLAKFLGFLNSSALYFSRHDTFDDPFEGQLSDKDKEFLKTKSGNLAGFFTDDKAGCCFSNCWVMSDADEYVLWDSYSSLKDGIAIKSTVGSIIEALYKDDPRAVRISAIHYIDRIEDYSFEATGGIINALAPHLCKRLNFQAEKEMRVFHFDSSARFMTSPKGLLFKVDPKVLIEEVFVSPRSYDWFQDSIKEILEKYNLNSIPVRKSEI